MEEVIAHAVDDDRRDLGAPGAVEVRHGMAGVLAAERGKLISDDVHRRDGRRSRSSGLSHGIVQRVSVETSLTNSRFPETAGCVHVSLSATL
jgi:hypothetical protein